MNSKCSLSLNRDSVVSLLSHLTHFEIIFPFLDYPWLRNSLMGYYPPGNQRFPAKQHLSKILYVWSNLYHSHSIAWSFYRNHPKIVQSTYLRFKKIYFYNMGNLHPTLFILPQNLCPTATSCPSVVHLKQSLLKSLNDYARHIYNPFEINQYPSF